MRGKSSPLATVFERSANCVLALLLLLTPICSQFCRAQACETPPSSHQHSPCHQSSSTSMMANSGSADYALSSHHICLLQQPPSAWLRPQSITEANYHLSPGSPATHALVNLKPFAPASVLVRHLPLPHSLHGPLASSLPILRI